MLLSLPPEIRNSIYGLVLTVKPNVDGHVTFGKRPRSGNNAATYSVQAVLQTCKQVYNEAMHVFYSVNTIRLRHLQVKTFLTTMSVKRLSLIQRIAIHGM